MRKSELFHETVTADLLEDVCPVLLMDQRNASNLPDRVVSLQVMVPLDTLLRVVERIDDFFEAQTCREVNLRLYDREELLKSCALGRIEDANIPPVSVVLQSR